MCPANGKRCNISSRYNHFAAVCRYDRDTHASGAQNSRQPGGYQNRRKRRVQGKTLEVMDSMVNRKITCLNNLTLSHKQDTRLIWVKSIANKAPF